MATENTKPKVKIAEVKRNEKLSPNMRRIVLTGSDLLNFPSNRNGANLKLVFPESDWDASKFRAALQRGFKPIRRTYTVRDFRADSNELDIDFVTHGEEGPAGRFAQNCRPGDIIGIAGPGSVKLNKRDADKFLFSADLSALPAAAAAIESLPKAAAGAAFFEITTEADKYQIVAPGGIRVNWLIHSTPHETSYQLVEAIKAIDWLDENTSVFAAGEHSSTMAIRDYIIKDRCLPRENTYIAGYWKIGLVEEEHQKEKRK